MKDGFYRDGFGDLLEIRGDCFRWMRTDNDSNRVEYYDWIQVKHWNISKWSVTWVSEEDMFLEMV